MPQANKEKETEQTPEKKVAPLPAQDIKPTKDKESNHPIPPDIREQRRYTMRRNGETVETTKAARQRDNRSIITPPKERPNFNNSSNRANCTSAEQSDNSLVTTQKNGIKCGST